MSRRAFAPRHPTGPACREDLVRTGEDSNIPSHGTRSDFRPRYGLEIHRVSILICSLRAGARRVRTVYDAGLVMNLEAPILADPP